MKDKQRETFENLVFQEIPDLINGKSLEIADGLTLEFKLIDIDLNNMMTDEDGTEYVQVATECKITNTFTTESISFNVNLLKLPVYQELGFMIRGNYMQMLDAYDKTPGLHTLKKFNASNDIDKAILQDDHFKSIGFVRNKSKLYTELSLRGKVADAIQVSPYTFLRAITGMTKEDLVAKFGYSNNFVATVLDGNRETFPECKQKFPIETRNDCINAVYAAIFGKGAALNPNSGTISQKLNEINKWLFNPNYFSKNLSATERIRYVQSFGYRAIDKVLTNTVNCNGITVEAGTVLTADLLRELDATELDELCVTYEHKNYVLHKFARYWFGVINYKLDQDIPELGKHAGDVITLADIDDLNSSSIASIKIIDLAGKHRVITRDIEDKNLSLNDIFTVFDIWVNNLNGLAVYDDQFDLTNRRLMPFDKLALAYIEQHLNTIVARIKKNYAYTGRLNDLEPYVENFDKDINLNAFIDEIRSPKRKLGLMSETCNAMSFVTKDYKSTIAGLKDIDDDLVKIQNHQYGRTDPLDVPESKKLASVQYRTVTSGLNEDGYITTPYLKVSNGEVVSKEPVYLTAIEETDRYIAEWNETFKNADGSPKKYVKARYNGDIVSTDIANISYIESSPYIGMSIAHSCIVFPGHSDAKRITMGCNQISQATPMAHPSRPFVNGGGESMVDYGFYYASAILENFYNSAILHRPYMSEYKDMILKSDLKLISKHTEHNKMTLTFSVVAMEQLDSNLPTFQGQTDASGTAFNSTNMKTCTLDVPCNVQTTNNTLLTFSINPVAGNVYHCDDVVCYSNSCSLEDKEHCDFMNVGHMPLDSSKFSKGLALTTNLRIGYKTWEGSTIDDAITISDECLYDDLLTSIFTTRVIMEVKSFSETEYEKFGIIDSKFPYFEESGLPKVGTYLNAGDPVIAKISHTMTRERVKYKYLKMNQSGQVIHAGFTKKNGEEVAEVILAQRAVVDVGDKLAGRCGNKGVVAKIVPAEQMPYDPETGLRLQILLNPLGVPSRQNISQFLDVDLTECMRQENKISYVSPYNDKDLEFVLDMKEVHNVHPKVFIDGRTGKPFERPIHWGTVSMYKLHHMVKKKYHAIGMSSPVDPVYMQPRHSSKLDGGQSFGEMEAWCLMSVGAKHVLQEIYSYQSTDIGTRGEIRAELENNQGEPYYSKGTNNNDATMLACFRSYGIDFKTNTKEQCFEFPPLTDRVIKSFSVMPVDSIPNLHNSMIFHGASDKLEVKDSSRNTWGWIDLHMKLIHPNFIHNSSILKLIRVNNTDTAFGKIIAELIMKGYVSVQRVTAPVESFSIYKTNICPAGLKGTAEIMEEPEDTSLEFVSGIDGLVMMFEFMNTAALERSAEAACDRWLSNHGLGSKSDLDFLSNGERAGYDDTVAWYHFVHEFNLSRSLADYVISAFPVIPQIYRPQFAGSKTTDHVDFDWYYAQILNAVSALSNDDSIEAKYRVYDRIKSFCGLNKNVNEAERKHKNLKSYFSGNQENDDHGKIRSNVQSKRVFCSGRTTIIPSHDTRLKPTEIGIPITLAVKTYESPLIGIVSAECNSETPVERSCIVKALLLCAKRDKRRFCKYWDAHFEQYGTYTGEDAYNWLTKAIYDLIENRSGNCPQVVIAGRQPSLHKYAIRAYRPKIVLENAINVHTLVCSGYNADFDGDQMWFQALISTEAKEEALKLLSPAVDYINPKDSSLILKHSQDVVLGLYCMSMLEKNATSVNYGVQDIKHYACVDEIIADLQADDLKVWEPVCVSVGVNQYLGTAGRVYLNSVVGGFTNEEFTNPLQIRGIKPELYKELRYDGIWRSGGNVKSGNFRYYKIADICMDAYNEQNDGCLDIMQKLTELGFLYSDKFGISLSLEDMMLKPEDESEPVLDPDLKKLAEEDLSDICNASLDTAEELQVAIEQDCYDGLISKDDKDDAIMTLYYKGTGDKDSEFNTGVHAQVMDKIMTKLNKTQRNNNIFIMLDSGARGKADQVMRMCGFLPQLQKDKTNSLKTPVTHSYLNGLSSFDVHMASYSTKQGLASTQNETPQAGYATRKGVYMTSGIQVVEDDCGKSDWWYDVQYGDLDDSRTRFIPSKDWFVKNLVGKIVDPRDTAALNELGLTSDNSEIVEGCFSKIIRNGGIHSIQFNDGTSIEISPISMIGESIHLSDKLAFIKLKNTLNERTLTMKSTKLAQKLHLPEVVTLSGTYVFKYKMTDCSKSLLLHRECKDLPYTVKRIDPNTGEEFEFTTEDTIAYIEHENLRKVPIRILLDCKSKHGVCAHCYGLKFSSLEIPRVGDYVGTEAAQALGEPSAQLTISLINQGGTAGAAINDGVKRFSNLLDGSIKESALVAPRNGYVSVKLLGKIATLSVKPVNKTCSFCTGCSVNGECPSTSGCKPCAFKKTLDSSLLCVSDGDWVEAGQPLTIQIPSPKSVDTVTVETDKEFRDTQEFKYVYRKKQVMWLNNYYETFSSKNIDINARHFELLTRVQNLQGFVYRSENPNFEAGKTYELPELLDAEGVSFEPRLSKLSKVIADTSGAMAALSFERIQSVAANLSVTNYKSSYMHNNSLLGAVAVGTDLVTGTPKTLGVTRKVLHKQKDPEPSSIAHVEYKEVESKGIDDTEDLFGDINFDAIMSNEPKKIDLSDSVSVSEPVQEVTEVQAYIPEGFGEEELDDLDDTNEIESSRTEDPVKIDFGQPGFSQAELGQDEDAGAFDSLFNPDTGSDESYDDLSDLDDLDTSLDGSEGENDGNDEDLASMSNSDIRKMEF